MRKITLPHDFPRLSTTANGRQLELVVHINSWGVPINQCIDPSTEMPVGRVTDDC